MLVFQIEPICAIGFGTVALSAGRFEDKTWCFQGYSLTGPSVNEMLQRKDFGAMPIIFEDFAKDNLASYTGKIFSRAYLNNCFCFFVSLSCQSCSGEIFSSGI